MHARGTRLNTWCGLPLIRVEGARPIRSPHNGAGYDCSHPLHLIFHMSTFSREETVVHAGSFSTALAGLMNTPSYFCGVFTIVTRRCALPPRGAGLAVDPLRSMSVFVSVSHCFDYYRFPVKFYNWKCESNN